MRLLNPACLLLLPCALALVSSAADGGPNFIHCSPLPPPPLQNFSQPLNHSDPASAYFNQRVQLFDVRPHTPGGAVLFYAGPENAANAYTMPCTALLQFAQQLNASGIMAAEHRFFGASWPDNVTKDNYRAVMASLTLHNILSDYAAIIRSFTRPGARYDGGRVIVLGGSYGGFLSAMLRIEHADVVFAAVASAAPVHLTGSGVDTGLWCVTRLALPLVHRSNVLCRYDSVAHIFAQQDSRCADATAAAFSDLKAALDAGAFAQVQQQLQLCALPDAATVGEFMILAMHAAQVIVQFNYPFKSAAKVPFPFQSFCSALLARPHHTLADLRMLLDIGYNNSGTLSCFGPKQQLGHLLPPLPLIPRAPQQLPVLRDISFELSWFYITCTFFGLPVAAGAAAKSFFSFSFPYDLPAINNYCQTKLFWDGVVLQPQPPISEELILNSSRIIFSNQQLDPVAAFSIAHSLSDTLLLLPVANASHTQDVIAYDDQVCWHCHATVTRLTLLYTAAEAAALPRCSSRAGLQEQTSVTRAREDEASILNMWLLGDVA